MHSPATQTLSLSSAMVGEAFTKTMISKVVVLILKVPRFASQSGES